MHLGIFQNNGSIKDNSLLEYWSLTDTQSINSVPPGKVKILQSYCFPNFRWDKAFIQSRFDLAVKYSSQVDYLVFLLQEEIYTPERSTGFQQVPLSSANGSAYILEGVTIPAMPSAGSEAFFLALLQAWKALCIRLGKGMALCGSPASCSDDAVWPYVYGNSGVSFIAGNVDLLFLYHYPPSISLAQGATCTQMNGNPGKNNAKSYIDFWRGCGYKGLINYIITTRFPDNVGTTDINIIDADFKNAYDNLNNTDIVSSYPYANGVFSDSSAIPRLITLYNKYNGNVIPIGTNTMTTLLVIGDPHMGEASNRVAELTNDFNVAKSLSPTGQIDRIFCTGDFEGIPAFDQAHKASSLGAIPAYIIPGNHDTGNISDIKKYQGVGDTILPGPAGTSQTSFSLNIGDFHIVMLNLYWDGKTNEGWLGGGSSGGEVGSALLAWLKADLAAATTKYKIVMGHEPMYPDRRHTGDSLDWNKTARDALQKVLNDAGVDAFFSGHTHYGRADLIGSVLQVQDGVPGSKAGTTGDSFRSMWFVHIATNGDMIITWKHNGGSGSSWPSPVVKTWTLPQGGVTPPTTDMTLEELALHPKLVAINGKIIDMFGSSSWGTGAGHHSHAGGKDYTAELASQHGMSIISSYPVIGNLITVTPPPPAPVEGKPILESISPAGAALGADVVITIRGSNFATMSVPSIYKGGVLIGHGYNISRNSTENVFHDVFKMVGTYTIKMENRGTVNTMSDTALSFVVTTEPVPVEETFECEKPLNGWKIGSLGTRLLDPACNPPPEPVTKYRCSGAPDYVCIPVTDGTGIYDTLADCQTACQEVIPPLPVGEFDLSDPVKVESVLKGISDLLDSIRIK